LVPLLLLGFCAVPHFAFGQEVWVHNPVGFNDLNSMVAKIIDVAFTLAGVVAVIFLVVAGFRYITSGGNAEAVEGAKTGISNAIIGIIVILLAWLIINFVLKQLNVREDYLWGLGSSASTANSNGTGGGRGSANPNNNAHLPETSTAPRWPNGRPSLTSTEWRAYIEDRNANYGWDYIGVIPDADGSWSFVGAAYPHYGTWVTDNSSGEYKFQMNDNPAGWPHGTACPRGAVYNTSGFDGAGCYDTYKNRRILGYTESLNM